LRRRKPFIKELLHPIRDGDCPNVATFSNKIYDRPTIIPLLKVIETEVGEFSPSTSQQIYRLLNPLRLAHAQRPPRQRVRSSWYIDN
jgi:hypothetical protein